QTSVQRSRIATKVASGMTDSQGRCVMAETSNDIPIEAWDTVLFEKFVRFRDMLPLGLARHGAAALEQRPYPPGARVLDIGCGFGDSTLQIAAMLGPSGRAVGVDCAKNFIREAESDAKASNCTNASFFVADVQSEDLR